MIRLTLFIIALLLAVEALAPTAPWLTTLAVLSGIELVRWRPIGRRHRVRRWLRGWVAAAPSEEEW
jgi:hypothetical protein